jgi:anti-sigma B factor antagonist
MAEPTDRDSHHGDAPGDAWYQVDEQSGCAVVRVGGDIDARTVHAFHEVVTEAAGLSRHVIIDLADVTFVDSSGLGALIVARKSAREAGGSISLVSPPLVVRRLLGSTQLHDVFAIYDSLAEAVRARPQSGLAGPD